MKIALFTVKPHVGEITRFNENGYFISHYEATIEHATLGKFQALLVPDHDGTEAVKEGFVDSGLVTMCGWTLHTTLGKELERRDRNLIYGAMSAINASLSVTMHKGKKHWYADNYDWLDDGISVLQDDWNDVFYKSKEDFGAAIKVYDEKHATTESGNGLNNVSGFLGAVHW